MATTLGNREPIRAALHLGDDIFRALSARAWPQGDLDAYRASGWTPPVDIYEDEQALVLRFDLPEVRKEDVRVTLEKGVLTIEGSRKLEFEERRENYHRLERAHGKFARSFSLPSSASAENLRAELRDGVLNVRVEKKRESQRRTIEIT